MEVKKIGRFDDYRTTAFSGFDPPPSQKHIKFQVLSLTSPSKYVPLRRSKSMEDIFGFGKDIARIPSPRIARIKRNLNFKAEPIARTRRTLLLDYNSIQAYGDGDDRDDLFLAICKGSNEPSSSSFGHCSAVFSDNDVITEKRVEMKKIGRFDGYRTTAFFGFDPPKDPTQNHRHFHVPNLASPCKFVPLCRKKPMTDIFVGRYTEEILTPRITRIKRILNFKDEPTAFKRQTLFTNFAKVQPETNLGDGDAAQALDPTTDHEGNGTENIEFDVYSDASSKNVSSHPSKSMEEVFGFETIPTSEIFRALSLDSFWVQTNVAQTNVSAPALDYMMHNERVQTEGEWKLEAFGETISKHLTNLDVYRLMAENSMR